MNAGWYADPSGGGGQRYWDGAQWTDHVTGPQVQAAQPTQYVVTPKNPAVSLLISFFIPGVGSMMNGDVGIGIAILAGAVVSLVLTCILIGFLTLPLFWIWGLIDAYQGAQRWNLKHGVIS